MKKLLTLTVAAVTMLALAIPAGAGGHDENPSPKVDQYTYDIDPVPHPGTDANEDVDGTVRIIALPNGKAQIKVDLTGVTPNAPHAQHLHGNLAGGNECPGSDLAATAIEDGELVAGDDFIATLDAAGAYGGVQVSLTTTGDTSPASVLAVSRFPVADEDGNLKYRRTIELSGDVFDSIAVLHYVVHGIDIDENRAYDGFESPLTAGNPDLVLPFEATVPAGCGGPSD